MSRHPGSRWWKVDFHAHTPKSICYGRGRKDEADLRKRSFENWLLDYMDVEIDCVVVTDHNTGDAIDEMRSAYDKLRTANSVRFRNLYVIPGVEITTHDGVHVLGIFPQAYTSSDINSVVDRCRYNGEKGKSNSCTEMTTVNVVMEITKSGGIAVPAHVNAPKGIFSIKSDPVLTEICRCKSIFCIEHEKQSEVVSSEVYKKQKCDWTIVCGSDQHHPNGEIGEKYPGSHYTWIKMENPCFDEMVLALKAPDVCVLDMHSKNPNMHPGMYVKSISIKDMIHCGKQPSPRFSMKFNPLFNAIIGGRGSGKSTILESVRIAGRRIEDLVGYHKIKNDLEEFMNPCQKNGVMGDDTEISIDIHRRGKDFKLTWKYPDQYFIREFNNGEWNEVDDGEITARFPLSIYSQKQIYTLASNPRGLLKIIDRVPEVNRLEWLSRWEQKRSLFMQLREQERELLRKVSKEKTILVQIQDIDNDLKTYETFGHKNTLQEYTERSNQLELICAESGLAIIEEMLESAREKIDINKLPEELFGLDDDSKSEIIGIFKAINHDLVEIEYDISDIIHRLGLLAQRKGKLLTGSRWHSKVSQATDAYRKIYAEYHEKGKSLDDYDRWVEQRKLLQVNLNQISQAKKDLEATKTRINNTYQELIDLRSELFVKRKSFLDKVLSSNPYVRIQIIQFGDISTLEEDFRECLHIENKIYSQTILDEVNNDGLLWKLFSWEKNDSSGKELQIMIQEVKDATASLIYFGTTPDTPKYIHGRFPQTLQNTYKKQPSVLDSLCCWWPEDLLRVMHGDPRRKYEEIEKGSAGQKAAAILAFLLSYGDDPLIIDQPEDDLDSKLIYTLIVKSINKIANPRQIIFATHNANIVVNGDAELVNTLRFGKDQIRLDASGGLGKVDIQNSICDIMEGGEKAFKKRYKRIVRSHAE